MNPFDNEYMEQEIAFYDLIHYADDHVRVVSQRIEGRCDDFLNVNYRNGLVNMPMLFIEDQLWMSLSFMEVQSQWVPIQQATGHVGIAGLGLGYAALRIAAKPEVTRVTIFELNQQVIQFFIKNFSEREGFEKIGIVHGDARENMTGMEFDYAYVDIYQSLLPDTVVTDALHFLSENRIGGYHFWGIEKALLQTIMFETYSLTLDKTVSKFVQYWLEDEDRTGLWRGDLDEKFVENVLGLNITNLFELE